MSKASEIYGKLLAYYGEPPWWSENPFEVIIGAILVQNTAWGNEQKVIANFKGNLNPEYVESLTLEKLQELIKPCGFFKAKSVCLKDITQWYKKYDYSSESVRKMPQEEIRKELLSIKGIGYETADVIMLYAFYYPVFVIDAYTKRLAERCSLPCELSYDKLQHFFETGLKREAILFGHYHWLILTHAIQHCKKKPICTDGPLIGKCHYSGQNEGNTYD